MFGALGPVALFILMEEISGHNRFRRPGQNMQRTNMLQ
ncbi:MAG: hypothetical protein HSCHL_2320 [Hydrogenibacillus schlegelii]|uniref:Uncharacterized protein n=1 Tax=Hydrogenibacillus schlegelii TaxID=1484 RepID=A0A2T5GEX0_HYDSH|nr:MAG: hypothetical protein HSCHL_2320 [Hydrogenibacillus schlegelii]